MALKDKLMTLEDFKAVRDVDVASNTAQFTEIKADLDALPALTDDIKSKLLACFQNVVWNDRTAGEAAYQALINSLTQEARQWSFVHTKVVLGSVNGVPKLMENRPHRILLANLTGEHPILNESDVESSIYFIPITQGAEKFTIIEHDGEPTTDNEYPFACGFVHYNNGSWVVDFIGETNFSGTYIDISAYNDGNHYLWSNIAKWSGTLSPEGKPRWTNVDISNVNISGWSLIMI